MKHKFRGVIMPIYEARANTTKTPANYKNISPLACFLIWIGSSAAVNFILEWLQRGSLTEAFRHLFLNFPIFLINTAIVMLTTSLMLIVRRKWFAFAVPTVIWLVIGVTNAIVLGFRPLPISASDFRLTGEATQLIGLYMKSWQISLIVIGIVAVLAAMVLLFRFGPRYRTDFRRDIKLFAPAFVLLAVYIVVISVFEFFPRGDETPNEYYERNGFAYNFYKSAGATGVNTPDGYSSEKVENLKEELNGSEAETVVSELLEGEKPNIIVLQLESFFDMSWMNGITLSVDDPVPNFRKLCDEYPSGYLYVPSYGGGTSNVEFEVLTGMNLDHFTIGESPYYTLLKDNVIGDAVPFNMKKMGYTAHAIHNYNALFYERNRAYSHLGFDTFTPIEYMNGYTRNSLSWTKDDILPGEIMSALKSTDGSDFVFTVSVQGHGPYAGTVDPNEFKEYIDVQADNLTEEKRAGLSFYASTAKEMDDVVGDLVNKLENFDEKCVLVIYGDHLPAIDFTVNYLSAPNAYTSEYVIWSNFKLGGEDMHLETYQLMAQVQKMIGTNEGVLTKYHHKYMGTDDYQDGLKLLEYSMTSEDAEETAPSELKYSCHPIKITSIDIKNEFIFVYGENFTPCSKIVIGEGDILETEFSSPERLVAKRTGSFLDAAAYVAQTTRDGSAVLEYILPEK